MSPISSVIPIIALLASLHATTAAPVHSLQQDGQCIQVAGEPSNGAAVMLGDCNPDNDNPESATGQQWIISPGNNPAVQLYGTEFCLDGQADEPGQEAVVFPCIQNPAQTWWYTGDNRVAITGGDQCLTSADDNLETENCAPNVAAQAFSPTLLFDTDEISTSAAGGGATSTASAATESDSSVASDATASASSVASEATESASSAAESATESASSAIQSATESDETAASSIESDATTALESAATAASSAAESIGSAAESAATSAPDQDNGGVVDLKRTAAAFWVAVGVAAGVAVVA